MKYCIHGRTEKQQCKACNLQSDCCGAAVLKDSKLPDTYTCESCGKNCGAKKGGHHEG